MSRIAGRATSRVAARRSSATGGVGKAAAVAAPARVSLEVAAWRVGRRGLLTLTLSIPIRGRSETAEEIVASIELRRDHRGPTDGDWVFMARRVSHRLSRAEGGLEVDLLLEDCVADCVAVGNPIGLPERLPGPDGAQAKRTACSLIARVGGPALLLTDLPAQFGLRGGTYVEQGVASVDALAVALRGS